MTSRHILPLVVILGLMITACRPRMQSISSGQVQVPQHITSLTDQLDYIIGHYWDHGLPADAKPDAIEYRIYDFCGFISGLDTARVSPALVRSLEQCTDEQLPTMLRVYKAILSDRSSPLYDDMSYQIVLSRLSYSSRVDSAQRVEAQLDLARRNIKKKGFTR